MVGLLISEPTWKQSYLYNIYPWVKLKRPTPKWIESILASWGPEARLKPHLHLLKNEHGTQKCLAPCVVYPCRDLLREVVSATLKFWALVPHYIWDRYVYTSKIVSAVPSNRQHGVKNLACRADFLARVNGVWETQLLLIAGKTFGRIVFALVPQSRSQRLFLLPVLYCDWISMWTPYS